MRTFIAFIVLAGLGFAASADDVYRWVDSNGVVHYSDKPQSPKDKPVQLPGLQTYKSGTAPPGFDAAEPPPKPAVAEAAPISITEPAQGATVRDPEGKFTISVSANLGQGEGLIYYLDGTALNQDPTPSTAYLCSGVPRGEHHVTAAVVGADGHEVARAAPVTVYLMQPRAKH